MFNPIGPKLLTIADLSLSGDAGAYRGQVRLEHFYKPSDAFQLTTQVALSEPTSTIFADNRRILEDNGWPNFEGRVATGLGSALDLAGVRSARAVEVGVSGIIGELRNAVLLPTPDTPPAQVRSVILVWGLGSDVRVAVTERFGLVAEGFVGQSLGEYNAMIGQSFGADLGAIRGAGGFGEAYFYVTDRLHVHAGYGIDAPVVRDLGLTQIARNQTYYSNLICNLSKVGPGQRRSATPAHRLRRVARRQRPGLLDAIPVAILNGHSPVVRWAAVRCVTRWDETHFSRIASSAIRVRWA